jgi:predicted metal-dependent phosphotriesterase family hydrolase
LSPGSGVQIVACTGFHLRKYYPTGYWLWNAGVNEGRAYFVREITEGLEETRETGQPVRAGFIKIACEDDIARVPAALLEAATLASLETGAAIEVHTEKGAEAEEIVGTLTGYGLQTDRIILCHIDKRPDFELHRALAQEGVLLEYDTFYRPEYQPETNVWPLLEKMIAASLERQIVIATDMADPGMWTRLGGTPGLTGLVTQIVPRLQAVGFGETTISQLVGGNIANRLAHSEN